MASAQSTKPSTIEFTDILLTTALPLHPSLAAHPCLSVALIEDEEVCTETTAVNGDLAAGIWQINSSLSANSVKQSVTLAVVATKNGATIRFASVTLSVAELLERIEVQPDEHQEFAIADSSSSTEIFMSCMVKAAPSLTVNNPPSHIGTRDNHTVENRNSQSSHELNSSELPSRDYLESAYANIIHMPDRDGRKARGLSLLGRAYYAYYQKTRGETDLERAISIHEEAMQFTGPSHPQLAELAAALVERSEQSGDPVDVEQAISHYQTVLEATEDLDEDKPGWLSNLGNALELRFQYFGDLSDLESAILNKRKAVELTPDGHPYKPTWLSNLGNALQTRFERLGSFVDLADAISNNRKAVELMQNGHPNNPGLLSSLGNALLFRFQRLGSVADLEDAISNHQKAIELTPDDPGLLINLGNALQLRFERLGSVADLEGAILNRRKAIELMPNGHSKKPGQLNNLGNALHLRFQGLGSVADLEDAISNNQKSVELTPDGHPDKPRWLNNLGKALKSRFERMGSVADLEDTISNNQKAIELMPDGHSLNPDLLENLGSALQLRFKRLGSVADLEDAILNNQKAIELMPNGHPERAALFNNLGNALQSRFERLGSIADLEGAISNKRKAVELTPDGHPNKPILLNNLGNALQIRFMRLGRVSDLEDAVSNNRNAIELTPDGHPIKPTWLHSLGSALQIRFECLSSVTDLEDAISSFRKAVQLTPDGHPDKPVCLYSLGNAFLTRFRGLSILSDLERALSTFSTATNSTSGSAMVRFYAAQAWAKAAEEHSRSPLEAFSCAIDLLPQIAWLGLTVTDQHALLADVGGIVRDAVAAAIRYEEYETAVVWVEQGRSIVWQNLLGLRNPVDDLREGYPELANRLRRIAAQLEGSVHHEPLVYNKQKAPAENVSQTNLKLALEWDNLVEEIRSLPNFEGFLKAKTFRQLAPAAHEGLVVILNVNDVRCDALVLIADKSAQRHVSALNIPLERFSHEKSKKMFQGLTELLSSAGVRERNDRKTGRAQSQANGETKFKSILRILWQDVVKPVIDGLELQARLLVFPVFVANVLSSGRIKPPSSSLVVRNRSTRIPTDSCRWAVRCTRSRGESLRLCGFLIYPDGGHHPRTVRSGRARRLSSFDSRSSVGTWRIAHSPDRGRGSNCPKSDFWCVCLESDEAGCDSRAGTRRDDGKQLDSSCVPWKTKLRQSYGERVSPP